MLMTVVAGFYLLCVMLVSLYATGTGVLLLTYLRFRHRDIITPQIDSWPGVAVQLPVYNERYVIERLLEAVAALDYPRDRLIIQVLDDSTDNTSDVIATKAAALGMSGLRIDHVRRTARTGYKAGALAHGLALLSADPEIEYVAVFDADFIPSPDFLRRTIPHLVADAGLGMVQGRWGHLNSDDNPLTMGQTLALDGHFIVEQTARNRAGWLMNFNGTAGVWRIKAIDDAGGWLDTTLTEDLDLSYRAQLKGWRFLYLPDIVVPAELPPQMNAYKQQQARWAKGGTQCATMLLKPVWAHPRLSLAQRLMATMHLCQYLVHPLLVCMLLLTPPLLIAQQIQRLPLGFLGLVGIAPPLVFAISQADQYRDWPRRLLALPVLIAFGTGIAWSNTRAVIGGLLGRKGEFKRTPKFAHRVEAKRYAIGLSRNTFFELALAAYALWGAFTAARLAPGLVPYLLLYSIAFGAVSFASVRDDLDNLRALHHIKAL